ncbi:MAG: dephospho-CoA kinase [Candidatus Omnitrophica bacterium]|nr:dephospho-CoA kinase [Candidatus Omnitrophota bacterium]
MNITLTGFMGTGKTAVGKRLARRLGWRFVDVDSLIVASAKESVTKIFVEHGEAVFRRLEQRMIRRVVRGHEQVIATGGGAFVNPENRRLLRAVGPVICLTAKPKVILARVGPTLASRPMLTSSPTPLSRIQHLLTQRASSYAHADLTVDTSELSLDEVVARLWEQIGPWVSKSWHYLLTHNDKLCQRYGGRYIAVLDDRIAATGATQLEAYRRLRKPVPSHCEVGIYYIPLPEESAIAL